MSSPTPQFAFRLKNSNRPKAANRHNRYSCAAHERFKDDASAEADALARAAGFSEEKILAAKRIYVAKCAKCHKLYNPATCTGTEWESWMQKMARKSKLKPEQYDLLAHYLGTFRKRLRSKAQRVDGDGELPKALRVIK